MAIVECDTINQIDTSLKQSMTSKAEEIIPSHFIPHNTATSSGGTGRMHGEDEAAHLEASRIPTVAAHALPRAPGHASSPPPTARAPQGTRAHNRWPRWSPLQKRITARRISCPLRTFGSPTRGAHCAGECGRSMRLPSNGTLPAGLVKATSRF